MGSLAYSYRGNCECKEPSFHHRARKLSRIGTLPLTAYHMMPWKSMVVDASMCIETQTKYPHTTVFGHRQANSSK
ncbi:hypothetical protein ACU8KH_03708 [Lachancea thermotolerans]